MITRGYVYIFTCRCLADAVIFSQNPDTKAGALISRELGQEGGVQVAALLEKALHQRDEAMATKEEKRIRRARYVCIDGPFISTEPYSEA